MRPLLPDSLPVIPARDLSADVIRAVATILVLVVHAAAPLVVTPETIPSWWWWTANFFDAAARPCVPLFVMLSGMLLLETDRTSCFVEFLRRRFVRVWIPFTGWAAVYFLWRGFYHSEVLTPFQILEELVCGPVYGHLWFVYMILGVYLFIPLLRIYARVANGFVKFCTVALWFTVTTVPAFRPHWPQYIFVVDISGALCFTGYALLGDLLRDTRLHGSQKTVALVVILLSTLVTALGTGWWTAQSGALDTRLYDNFSTTVLIASVALFLWLRSIRWVQWLTPGSLRRQTVLLIASASLKIYLSHILFIELLQGGMLGFVLRGTTLSPLAGIMITTVIVVFLCLASNCLLEKLKAKALVITL